MHGFMLSELINILDEAEVGFDHLQLAEALWLAQFNPRVEILPTPSDAAEREPVEQPKPEQTPTAAPQQSKPQPTKKLHAKTQATGTATLPARAVPMPDVAALPDALAIGRAMRPLRRRAASRRNWRLDEEATAEASAEASAPGFIAVVPVMRPAMERWFDLELVVEQSASMAVWRDAAREFEQLLEQLGAFGDVRRWTLFRHETRAMLLDAAGREHSTRVLRDSVRRRLVMVFSDGSSRGWMNGAFASAIAEWSEHAVVVLAQPLGERLWGRTQVGDAVVEIASPEPGAPNSRLRREGSLSANGKEETQVVLPVVSLKPEMFARWARMVAQPGNRFRAAMLDAAQPVELPIRALAPVTASRKRGGLLWQLREWIAPNSPVIVDETPAQPAPAKTVSAASLVAAYSAKASPEAFALAVYLSLMPLTMEIMRVTQQAMFRAPQLEHLAEFLLGGLVSVITTGQAGGLSNPEFEFHPGVREELLPTIRRSEIERWVRNAVSDLMGQRIGSVREFIALILDPKGKERLPVAESYAQFFAEFTLPALRQLGYEFDSGDEPVDIETEIPPPPLGINGLPSPVKMVSFNFRTARLKPDGKILKLDTGHAWQFTEMLDSAPLEMVFIPGGKFTMGAPESEKDSYDWERPQHEVTVSPFYIGKFTVTQAQWRVVAGWKKIEIDLKPEPSRFKGDDRPVEQISWEEAKEFCARVTKQTGGLYRLPSEAEWEYACRAGTTTPFAFGETITPEFVNYNGEYPYGKAKKGEYRKETVAVGSLGAANDFGLFDMHGNVWEWCEDWYGDYSAEATTDPSGPGAGSARVFRGGGWYAYAVYCRSAYRYGHSPGYRYDSLGFRLVRIGR